MECTEIQRWAAGLYVWKSEWEPLDFQDSAVCWRFLQMQKWKQKKTNISWIGKAVTHTRRRNQQRIYPYMFICTMNRESESDKSELTFGSCGPGGGLAAQHLLLLHLAGSSIQLLQHGGAQLGQALPVQLGLLTDAVNGQRVCSQALGMRTNQSVNPQEVLTLNNWNTSGWFQWQQQL